MARLKVAPSPSVCAPLSPEMPLLEPRPNLLSSTRSPGPALARAQRSARCRGRRRGRVSRLAAVLDVPGGPRVAPFRITQAPATPGGPPRRAAMKDTLMPRAVTGYRSLLCTPGAAAFFFSAAAGRVGIAMTGLGLVWLL